MAAQPLRKPDPDHRSYTERIRELVEQDRVEGARKLLAEALEQGGETTRKSCSSGSGCWLPRNSWGSAVNWSLTVRLNSRG